MSKDEEDQFVRNSDFPEKEINKETQDKTRTMKHVDKDSV